MSEKLIEIYWSDLTQKAQESIAELIGIAVDNIPYETNWDTVSMTTIPYYPVE